MIPFSIAYFKSSLFIKNKEEPGYPFAGQRFLVPPFFSDIIKNIHLSFRHIIFKIEEFAGNKISMPVPIIAVHQTFFSLSIPVESTFRTFMLICCSPGTPVHFAYRSHFCIPCIISALMCCAICARTDSSGNGISSDRSRILFVILSSYFSSDI